jgi:hypothetical protein
MLSRILCLYKSNSHDLVYPFYNSTLVIHSEKLRYGKRCRKQFTRKTETKVEHITKTKMVKRKHPLVKKYTELRGLVGQHSLKHYFKYHPKVVSIWRMGARVLLPFMILGHLYALRILWCKNR